MIIQVGETEGSSIFDKYVGNFNLMNSYKKVQRGDSNLLCTLMGFKFDLSYINLKKKHERSYLHSRWSRRYPSR